ncbi:MAG: ImmA/IrrE family metallo-endopeptidase [Chromatiaceae bacterium]|jgi:Zn-dependent peptidase ImmA (M78 family)
MDIKTLMGVRARAARDAAGLTQSAAAERLDIARQTLANMEQGRVPFDGVQLVAMANLYGRPVTYFYDLRESDGTAIAFRADNPEDVDPSLKQRLLDRLAAIADLEIAAGLNINHGLPPTEPLSKAGQRELNIVRSVAQEERGRLGVGDRAPVSDPVALLESIDVRVIPFKLAPQDGNLLSGFSAFSESLGAGIFVNVHESLSIEHQVFCVLHEYAHLIFHRNVYREPGGSYRTRGKGASPEEKIANTFAGAFLVPDAALRQHAGPLGRISPTDVSRLKRLFRISFTGMLTRLYQEGYLNKTDNARLWSICRARGWDKHEPEALQEPPAYGRRTEALARTAWERGEASMSFLGEVLGRGRKAMRDLVSDWEQDAQVDAVH